VELTNGCSSEVNIFMDKVTSASLEYPLSVFNKNSTLKATQEEEEEHH